MNFDESWPLSASSGILVGLPAALDDISSGSASHPTRALREMPQVLMLGSAFSIVAAPQLVDFRAKKDDAKSKDQNTKTPSDKKEDKAKK